MLGEPQGAPKVGGQVVYTKLTDATAGKSFQVKVTRRACRFRDCNGRSRAGRIQQLSSKLREKWGQMKTLRIIEGGDIY